MNPHLPDTPISPELKRILVGPCRHCLVYPDENGDCGCKKLLCEEEQYIRATYKARDYKRESLGFVPFEEYLQSAPWYQDHVMNCEKCRKAVA